MNKRLLFTCIAVVWFATSKGQDGWALKENKGGIEIYTKPATINPNLKAIRVRCTLPATLTQFVAVILDVNTGADWVYSTKSSVLLKQVSPSEVYYYSEVGLPWPVSNRDFVAHLIASQNPQTKVVTIDGPVMKNYIPDKKGIVRVNSAYGKWIITPNGKQSVRIEYTLETDPAGSLPAWMVNLFVTKGPYETFKKLQAQLQKPVYQKAKLPFITDAG
jgi:hypothetical protein